MLERVVVVIVEERVVLEVVGTAVVVVLKRVVVDIAVEVEERDEVLERVVLDEVEEEETGGPPVRLVRYQLATGSPKHSPTGTADQVSSYNFQVKEVHSQVSPLDWSTLMMYGTRSLFVVAWTSCISVRPPPALSWVRNRSSEVAIVDGVLYFQS